MRTTRFLLTAVLLVSPALASAQTNADDFCTPTAPALTCSRTKVTTAVIPSVLYLGIINNGPITLTGLQDTVAYEATYRAMGNTAGTSGTVVTTPGTLVTAAASDSVVVLANRGYKLTIEATTDIFAFTADGTYATCRDTPTGPCAGNALAGKPVKDLYWSTDATTFAQIKGVTASALTPAVVKTSSTGGRYGKAVTFKSAWFYATDIPGSYSATVRYTVTGL